MPERSPNHRPNSDDKIKTLGKLQKTSQLRQVIGPIHGLPEHVILARSVYSDIGGAAHAEISCIVNDPQSRGFQCYRIGNRAGSIRAAIVDKNELVVLACSFEQIQRATEEGLDEHFLVVAPRNH